VGHTFLNRTAGDTDSNLYDFYFPIVGVWFGRGGGIKLCVNSLNNLKIKHIWGSELQYTLPHNHFFFTSQRYKEYHQGIQSEGSL